MSCARIGTAKRFRSEAQHGASALRGVAMDADHARLVVHIVAEHALGLRRCRYLGTRGLRKPTATGLWPLRDNSGAMSRPPVAAHCEQILSQKIASLSPVSAELIRLRMSLNELFESLSWCSCFAAFDRTNLGEVRRASISQLPIQFLPTFHRSSSENSNKTQC